ncbi:unnamed protein product [Prorocentrum cordatum]|uniref:Uncharacterized protein n=1 Tax=Prorocentrum cordatum TaxID=2364126 RepID=A0ABN9PKL5_9DINO|nr:unnamed protein product [Polarella glacialis]
MSCRLGSPPLPAPPVRSTICQSGVDPELRRRWDEMVAERCRRAEQADGELEAAEAEFFAEVAAARSWPPETPDPRLAQWRRVAWTPCFQDPQRGSPATSADGGGGAAAPKARGWDVQLQAVETELAADRARWGAAGEAREEDVERAAWWLELQGIEEELARDMAALREAEGSGFEDEKSTQT